MELTRYDVYALLDQSYNDEGHIDYAHAYIDYCEDKHGSWVSADDALALTGRIAFLENEVKQLKEQTNKAKPLYSSTDDWEPTMRFFRED